MKVAHLNISGWKKVVEINIPEFHDRIVVAVFFQEKADAILTNDEEIAKHAKTV